MDRLESVPDYTYSFFPDSLAKKNVTLNVYQRPMANYKLECENDPERTLDTLLAQVDITKEMPKEWNKLIDAMLRMGMACLLVIILGSLCT